MTSDLRDGRLADLHSYRLKLWIFGEVQLVVPQKLEKKADSISHRTSSRRDVAFVLKCFSSD